MDVSNLDMGKLRSQDQPYVRELTDYLAGSGMESVKLAGSAVKGTQDYEDIDLLAIGSKTATVKVWRSLQNGGFPPVASDGVPYHIESVEGNQYLDTYVDQRFKVQAGNTTIDLCLKFNE
jgi:hypothetical protein